MVILEDCLKELDIFKGSLLKKYSDVVVMLENTGTNRQLLILVFSFYAIPLIIIPISLR